LNEAHEQLRSRSGPAFDAWCYGLIEYASGLLEAELERMQVDPAEAAA
jgi:hypothetical protein